MKKILATLVATTLTACGAEDIPDSGHGPSVAPHATQVQPLSVILPPSYGPCPEFIDGEVTFYPLNIPGGRRVRLFMSDAARTKDGPLIFYWHGTGSSPNEAAGYSDSTGGLGPVQVAEIKDQGGIIAAPVKGNHNLNWPWYYVSYDNDEDLRVMDEVVACAARKVGINANRIHTLGFSAGGLQSTQAAERRSNYIASAVFYSGGYMRPMPKQNPNNKYAAMIFYGGPNDVVGMSFQDSSWKSHNDLKAQGHFSLICNHNTGHRIPDKHPGVWRFFQDHPFGVINTYPGGFPSTFPTYCQR